MDTTFLFHYITIGKDIAKDVHYEIIMGHDVVMGAYHHETMHINVARASFIMYYYAQL